jgi:pyruvate carboxylase
MLGARPSIARGQAPAPAALPRAPRRSARRAAAPIGTPQGPLPFLLSPTTTAAPALLSSTRMMRARAIVCKVSFASPAQSRSTLGRGRRLQRARHALVARGARERERGTDRRAKEPFFGGTHHPFGGRLSRSLARPATLRRRAFPLAPLPQVARDVDASSRHPPACLSRRSLATQAPPLANLAAAAAAAPDKKTQPRRQPTKNPLSLPLPIINNKLPTNNKQADNNGSTTTPPPPPPLPFRKILCANRGEIAIRVFRAGSELGLRTVAVYSPADRLQPHRYNADESYCVGTTDMQPVACYLDVEAVLAIAKAAGVDAIHPGYGFLSENATFARRCAEEGIAFVGPRPETIEAMGDKTAARRAALACGVPVVPGTNESLSSADEARAFAEEAGYPVILKAAMGGGGRGMRIVRDASEMDELFGRASAEAKAAFGDGSMFAEKYVEDPRHIEVQILADGQGGVVHLYERDCSVQRRHQKVVEVAPAPALDSAVKQRLYDDAVRLCRHVDYKNAGTVEFMVDKHGAHYFLEVNPRVQVEHTVTEVVTGVDIVQAQVRIAGGAKLSELGLGTQEAIAKPNGFAVQCRVTSEDPEQGFQPDAGRLEAYRVPGGPGIRLDGAVTTGNVVSRYYDSLLAKVVASAPTYERAVQRASRALQEFQVRGVKTNIAFLENVLRHPEFVGGAPTTSFIERNAKDLFRFEGHPSARASKLLAYLADVRVNGARHPGASGPAPGRAPPPLPAVPGLDAAAAKAGKKGGAPALSSLDGGGSSPSSSPLPPPPGWRDVLLREGPDGWAKAVRAHKGVLITDTTMRDAHQSLLATRMRTHDLLRAAPATSHLLAPAGSLECWGGATFDVALRFLHECPWRRLEQLREQVPNVPFQMLLRGANAVGYTSYPDNVVRAFCEEAVRTGVDIFRVFDSLNYLDNLKFGLDAVRDAGGVAEGTICYTGDLLDPGCKYNLDYYMALAEALVEHGVHALAVKDMAGLLKPRAATALIGALRRRFPDVVIHVHTHDSAGTGVATQLAAAAAGADIVDAALDAMSGLTSQPSMGAIVAALRGSEHDTGLDPASILELSRYWEGTRALYTQFESGQLFSSSDVYRHEMPGGQYTNLKFQASQTLGPAAASSSPEQQWAQVQDAYAAANRALGDIVKVTPSSKVVGDLAQFMVSNGIQDEGQLAARAADLSFPASVIEFFQGYLGQPPFGWPEPLRRDVLKGRPVVDGRPGASLPSLSLEALLNRLRDKYPASDGAAAISHRDVLSAALYPAVFDEYRAFCLRYSDAVERLPTPAFLSPLKEDDEVEIGLGRGVETHVRFKAVGELQPTGKRDVYFEVNGVPRVVEVEDTRAAPGGAAASGGGGPRAARATREKADVGLLGSVGAPMAGSVVEVSVKPGQQVAAGAQLAVLSAMKMETAVCAPVAGKVSQVAVDKGDEVAAGDLVALIEAVDAAAGGGGGAAAPKATAAAA